MKRMFMKAASEATATRFRAVANASGLSPLGAMRLAALAALDLAALAFAIGAVVGGGDEAQPPKTEWRPPRLLAPPAERGVADGEGAILSRPIFWRARRPLPPSASDRKTDPSAQAATTASGFTVAGIVKLGPEARAFLVSPSSPDGKWIVKGDNVDGWTINDITDLDVTLSDGAQTARLRLFGETPEP